jgi:hypothetical protein
MLTRNNKSTPQSTSNLRTSSLSLKREEAVSHATAGMAIHTASSIPQAKRSAGTRFRETQRKAMAPAKGTSARNLLREMEVQKAAKTPFTANVRPGGAGIAKPQSGATMTAPSVRQKTAASPPSDPSARGKRSGAISKKVQVRTATATSGAATHTASGRLREQRTNLKARPPKPRT